MDQTTKAKRGFQKHAIGPDQNNENHLARVLLADNLQGEDAEGVANWLRYLADNIEIMSRDDNVIYEFEGDVNGVPIGRLGPPRSKLDIN